MYCDFNYAQKVLHSIGCYSDPHRNNFAFKQPVKKFPIFFSAKPSPRCNNGMSEKKMDKAEEMEIFLSQNLSQDLSQSNSCQSSQSQTNLPKAVIGSDAFR